MTSYEAYVTEYTFFPGGNTDDYHLAITVARTHWGDAAASYPDVKQWAIRRMGKQCLNHNGRWEWEPQPSSRTKAFLERTRYDKDEALRRAAELAMGGEA